MPVVGSEKVKARPEEANFGYQHGEVEEKIKHTKSLIVMETWRHPIDWEIGT